MNNKEEVIPFSKIIHATKEDFEDFQGFVNRMEQDPEVKASGIVKVDMKLQDCSTSWMECNLIKLRGFNEGIDSEKSN